MKKVFSLLLAVLMLVSALPVAYAAGTNDYTAGTQVVYTAANNESYTITVPASLKPGQSGTVTLAGEWPANKTISVTADKTVTLTNSLNAADQKTLDVTFAGMEKAGDNAEAKTYTETVSVAAMPSDALFGTWNGKFNYNVEMTESEPEVEMVTITLTRDYDGRNSGRVYIGGYSGNEYCDGGSARIDDDWSHTWTSPTTIEVPVGTQITLETEYEDSYTKFLINGATVYDDETDYTSYNYTITKDANIAMTTEYVGQTPKYVMSITEAGAGPEMVTVTVNEISTDYAELCDSDGNMLYGGTYQFPVGTVLQCWICDYCHDADYDGVYLNGTGVAYASENSSTTYDYVLTKNVTIVVGADTKGYEEGRIEITEG